jgi:hypothetical protein
MGHTWDFNCRLPVSPSKSSQVKSMRFSGFSCFFLLFFLLADLCKFESERDHFFGRRRSLPSTFPVRPSPSTVPRFLAGANTARQTPLGSTATTYRCPLRELPPTTTLRQFQLRGPQLQRSHRRCTWTSVTRLRRRSKRITTSR